MEDLGFSACSFNYMQFDSQMKEKVLMEVIAPTISNVRPKAFLSRIIWKYRRWRANEWKHKLCYKESMWSAFWSGLWAKILKPKTI